MLPVNESLPQTATASPIEIKKRNNSHRVQQTSSVPVVRRDPYGSLLTKHGVNGRSAFQSRIVAHSPIENNSNGEETNRSSVALGASSIAKSANENGRLAAYNSYRHGTRSIARSRLSSSQDVGSRNELQHPVLSRTPQIDSAPDATLTQTVVSGLFKRGQKLINDLNGASELSIKRQRLLLLVPVLIIVCLSAPSMLEVLSDPEEWQWNPDRRLDSRQCVMNLFIERQPPDEYNPDYVDPKKLSGQQGKGQSKKQKQPPPEIADDTYRSKGQMKVVTRLIEAVADSFRSNTTVQQHLLFTGTRDGGQLAEIAMKHWPPRGTRRTQLHIIAADHEAVGPVSLSRLNMNVTNIPAGEDPLKYGYLDAIEERFNGKERVHIYDRSGIAGVMADDDDDDAEELLWSSRRNLQVTQNTSDIGSLDRESSTTDIAEYPLIEELISFEEGSQIVPYMHVDGESMANQMEILESARSLLEDNTIVVVGIEHSPDMDVYALLDFFNSVTYKTFFLGSRQIARIDHLCPEILDEIIRHPSITVPKPTMVNRLLKMFGTEYHGVDDDGTQVQKYPPFFVAMPRGRLNREEMTIQHMYDLFGGYGGGGGQIKTANDRKAPGKK